MQRNIGQNITSEVKGNELAIYVKLDGPTTRSASGKSEVIASTRGNVSVPETDLTLGLNLYRRR
jgi:hypothetical protein